MGRFSQGPQHVCTWPVGSDSITPDSWGGRRGDPVHLEGFGEACGGTRSREQSRTIGWLIPRTRPGSVRWGIGMIAAHLVTLSHLPATPASPSLGRQLCRCLVDKDRSPQPVERRGHEPCLNPPSHRSVRSTAGGASAPGSVAAGALKSGPLFLLVPSRFLVSSHKWVRSAFRQRDQVSASDTSLAQFQVHGEWWSVLLN